MSPELAEATLELERAKKRLNEVLRKFGRANILLASCSLCGASIGKHCRKPSGAKRCPHTERIKAAAMMPS